MENRDEEFDKVAKAQRTTKAEARHQGIGAPDEGLELPARSYPDATGVADLGVDEPVLPAPPATGDDDPRPGPDPTGMFAGETEAGLREEDRVRRVLEAGFPETRGKWKEGGRAPRARE
jgi:hypothetical protein